MSLIKTANDIMTKSVITIPLGATLKHFKKIFDDLRIHHLLVENRGQLVGIISSEDVIKATSLIIDELSIEASSLMTKELVTIGPETLVDEIVQIFLSKKFRALPVVNDLKEIKGIVTPYDILKLYKYESEQ